MDLKKPAANLIIFLAIISISIIAYTGSFLIVFNDQNFYKDEFRELNIYQKFPSDNIDAINHDLIRYLKYEKNHSYFETAFFSEREKKHLLDVKTTFQNTILIFYAAIALVVILLALLFIIERDSFFIRVFQIFAYGGIFTLLIGVILLFLVYYSFDLFFHYFHMHLFKENTWLFESTDNIINLYPSQFFMDFGVRLFIISIVISILLIIGAFIFFAKTHGGSEI